MANGERVNYSLYLVTDSTAAILGDRCLVQVVESALRGGASVVQYRDKHCSDENMVTTARELRAVTNKFGVPLLINDRVGVAVAAGCEGVHIGQDDMVVEKARAILGPGKIIGVSVQSKEQAIKTCEAGADYLGIGAVFATPTKKDTNAIIGPDGVRDILSALCDAGYGSVPTVCIGGINTSNATSVVRESSVFGKKSIDGIAVVSALVGAPNAAVAARDLLRRMIVARIPLILEPMVAKKPLTHNMTNTVVQNFAANVACAIGASPIMSKNGQEAADLARLGGSLVVNMGTMTPEELGTYEIVIVAYNKANRPVVLDPVGAGATAFRLMSAKALLKVGRFAVVKGNLSEILSIADLVLGYDHAEPISQHGVDSAPGHALSVPKHAGLVRKLARMLGCVVLLTGETDLISDGWHTVRVDNGHELMGMVTGTGCALGTTISATTAAAAAGSECYLGSVLAAVVAGTAMFCIAGEMAAARSDVRGPGSFVPALIDELYRLRKATVGGDLTWLNMLRVQVIEGNMTV